MVLSTEEQIHGGYLHLARQDLAERLQGAAPSLYDCLLASIYFRSCGDQDQALQVLDLHKDSSVFDATYNRLQSLCHKLDFGTASTTAQQALEQWGSAWTDEQCAYTQEAALTTGSLAVEGPFPTALHPTLVESNGYLNLDSGEASSAPGVVDHNRRWARLVDAVFDPLSQCWLEAGSGAAIRELLQPNHDFRAFFGGTVPWNARALAGVDVHQEVIAGACVFVESNPHYGHFVTQSASFANAIGYAEHLLSQADRELIVLSKDSIPPWGQELLQASCLRSLQFRVMERERPLRCKKLVVAPPTWIEWHYVHVDHQRLFRKAAAKLLGDGAAAEADSSKLLYFSRSRLSDCLRRSVNEDELEAELIQRGFAVVHPQELPLAEVVSLVNEAALIAGPTGSAMHNVLFRLPGAPLLTLNLAHQLPAINGCLVERCSDIQQNLYLRSSEEHHEPVGSPNRLEFNVARCLEGVEQALDQLSKLS